MLRTGLSPTLLAALSCLVIAACKPAAQTEASPSPKADAVALLDGMPIDRALLDEIARQKSGTDNPFDLPATKASAASAPAVDRQQLLDTLINVELLARKARERGLDKKAELQAESDLQNKTVLAQAVIREQIAGIHITDAELSAAYEERVPPHEFQLAHIAFADREQALAVLDQLRQGQAFAGLAKRHSLDEETRTRGGQLGWLMAEQMAPELLSAVRRLSPGQYTSQPVQTAQGWHLVQLQALRPLAERPTLAAARVWLHPELLHARVLAIQQQWLREADIRKSDAP